MHHTGQALLVMYSFCTVEHSSTKIHSTCTQLISLTCVAQPWSHT